MSENCNHDCAHCSANCSSRTQESLIAKPLPSTKIKKIIAVLSGKGGVGKSMVTSMLAATFANKGYKVGVMDADITGPSIPRIFGVKGPCYGNDEGILPIESKKGIKVASVNLMLDAEDQPVLWRGPVIGGMVKQFYTDVVWGELDYLFVDMPPGTGDVALTVFQSMPVDGIVIVTSPQELVSMIVAKAVNMANSMNVKVLGIVENMSYVECPDCGKHIQIFNDSHLDETAMKYNLNILGRLPLNPKYAKMADNGQIEDYDDNYLEGAVCEVESI